MPSNFLTPFLELDDEFCKSFRSLDVSDGTAAPTASTHRAVGFQRRHSLCPVTLPNSKFNSFSSDLDVCPWSLSGSCSEQQWNREQQLSRNSLSHIPFRVDRSVSMIEGHVNHQQLLPPPPPGLGISASSLTSSKSLITTPPISTRYKTELCRTYEESGACKYGAKCQFAHGMEELRGLNRHPKYKTEPCRTFHTIGFCPYGARCHFIHNADEQHNQAENGRHKGRERPQLLRQSVSFAGFSSQAVTGFQALPDPLAFTRAASVSPPPSTGSPELTSPLFPEPGALKHGYRYSADLGGETPHFFASTDSKPLADCAPGIRRPAFTGLAAMQRAASADSLSDQEGYYSSSSSLSGCDSPGIEGRRLPIFSRLSVSDD